MFARWGGYAVCAAGFVLTLAAFYPGMMSPDSTDQWEQGRRWWFYDAHPPLMAAVWGLLDRVVEGPALMLLFHNLLFWGGAAVFWRTTRDRAPRASLAFAAFGFLPPVWASLGTIWKDVGMGAALLLASALVYAAAGRQERGGRVFWALLLASALLMFYAYGVRLNAAPGVLPLALWGGFVACRALPHSWGKRRRRLAPLAVGLVYFALLTAAVSVTTRLLVRENTVYPHQQIFLFDLAAVAAETGRPRYPDYLLRQERFSPAAAAEALAPCGVNPLIYGSSAPMRISRDAGEVASLRATWLRAVYEEPGAYLRHRARVFACLTGIGGEQRVNTFLPATGGYNPPQFRRAPNALTRALTSYFFLFNNSPLFRGFVWLLLCAASAYVALRLGPGGREERAAFALALSGLLYGLGYFFYGPSSEFRYLWWTVLAACAAVALLLVRAAAGRVPGARGAVIPSENDAAPAGS
ncbi:MAG TPA: hypothetical protein VFZ44_16895 [Pyrinomonadaceae bacterium]